MDVRQLRYFAAVAGLRSLTAAAEFLGVTQPALGSQMKNLERDLNAKLIERHSRGVRLTDAGERLKMHADDLLERFKRAEEDIRRFGSVPGGIVRIGVTPSLGRVLAPKILEACADRHPEITLQFTQGFTDQLERGIAAKELDIAVTRRAIESERHETLPLYVEAVELIGAPDVLEGFPEPVRLSALADLPLALDERSRHVRKLLDEGLKRAGLKLADALEVNAVSIRREIVLQGKRCTLAPAALFASELGSRQLLARKIDLPGLVRTLHLAGPRVERMAPGELAVQGLILELMNEEIEGGACGWALPS